MFEYVIRRLLLMVPTFFGTTLLVFYILQLVPDGPFEQAVKQIKMAQMQSGEGGGATSGNKNSMEISEDVLEKLRQRYGLDKPIWKRYLIWLGLSKKELEYKEAEVGVPFRYTVKNLGQGKYVPVSLQQWILVNKDNNGNLLIYQSPIGTDFEWQTKDYNLLPDYSEIEDNNWTQSNIDEAVFLISEPPWSWGEYGRTRLLFYNESNGRASWLSDVWFEDNLNLIGSGYQTVEVMSSSLNPLAVTNRATLIVDRGSEGNITNSINYGFYNNVGLSSSLKVKSLPISFTYNSTTKEVSNLIQSPEADYIQLLYISQDGPPLFIYVNAGRVT